MNSENRFQPVARKVTLGMAAIALVGSVLVLPACSAQGGANASEGADSDVLATIGSKDVTRSEIAEEAKEGLHQAEMQKLQCESNYKRSVHEVMESTLKKVVQDRLIEEEAEGRGISRDELIQAEVDGKLGEVTDEEVSAFYEERKAQIRQPMENVEAQIRQHLAGQGRAAAYSAFIEGLETKQSVAYKLGPYRIDVESSGAAKGPASAPVTIVEFSDFQCPYCSRVVPTLKQVEEKYGDNVRVVFRHFPLNFHKEAQKASEASLCADEQGKFWEMHDLLFEEQRALQVADLKDKAKRLELDSEKFEKCLDSNKYYAQVQEDIQAGVLAGVSGTPAMFINGRFLSGAQPFEEISKVIDDELKSAGAV